MFNANPVATLVMHNDKSQQLSFVSGPTSGSLWSITLGSLAEIQSETLGDRVALVFPEQNIRRTYRELLSRSNAISKALLESGLRYGDCVGIFAGNCSEYLEVFLGASALGCPVVVLNSNYTPSELGSTIKYSSKSVVDATPEVLALTSPECKLLFISRYPGPNRDTTPHLQNLMQSHSNVQLVIFDDESYQQEYTAQVATFKDFYQRGHSSQMTEVELSKAKSRVRARDILNFQFTSGMSFACNMSL